jgi:transcription initiation factor TFIIB
MATRDIYDSGFDEDVSNDTIPCPKCEGQVRTNSVETVCEDCGLIIDEQRIDHGPEWRTHDQDQRKRTGAPLTATRHDRGLSTEIGRKRDANGNALSGDKRRHISRLRREHGRGRFRSTAERNLAHGLGEVRRIASVVELSGSLRDQACQLFRTAQNEDLLRGRSIEAIAAASIYRTCRCHPSSLHLDDLVDAARVGHARVTNAYKTLNTGLGLPTQPVHPSEFVPRLASELGVSDAIRRRAMALSKQHYKRGMSNGCQPSGVAAASIYHAAREYDLTLTQQQVADAAGVSAVTLRARWVELDAV